MTMPEVRIITQQPQLEAAAKLAIVEIQCVEEPTEGQILSALHHVNEGRELKVGVFDGSENLLATAGLLSSIGRPDSGRGMLSQVVTSPEHRREGWGRLVVGYAEDLARDSGVRRLELIPTKAAKPFYATLGYRENEDPFYRALYKFL